MVPGPFFYIDNTIYVLFHSLQTNIIFHTVRLILCFQQAGEIDNLTVELGQSFLIVLCRFHLPRQLHATKQFLAPLQRGDLQTCSSSPTGSITLVSQLSEICCCTTSHLPLGVSQQHLTGASSIFLTPLPGKQDSSTRSVSHFQSF